MSIDTQVDAAATQEPAADLTTIIRGALRRFTDRLVASEPVIVAGDDPEGVHQARVACRRIRSALRTFRPVLDADWADALRGELRDLATELGDIRDAEVLLGRLRRRAEDAGIAAGEADALLQPLVERRSDGRDLLLTRLRSPGHAALRRRLEAAVETPALRPETAGEDPLTLLVPFVIRDRKRLRRRARRLGSHSPDADLHAFRILVKRTRYSVMVVAPLVGAPAEATAAVLGELQDVLGEHQDAVVAGAWLEAQSHGPAPFAAGVLCAAERQAARESRARWRRAWRTADRPRVWAWL